MSDKKKGKQLGRLQEHLDPGEEVQHSVLGSYETENDSVRAGVFAATDRRLVLR